MRNKLFILIIISLNAIAAFSQDFGCYEIPSKSSSSTYGDFTYSRAPSIRFNFDWDNFEIAQVKNGYYKEYYQFPPWDSNCVKMEGFIKNGKREGKWQLYFDNEYLTGDFRNDKKTGSWTYTFITENNDTICYAIDSFRNDKKNGIQTNYDRHGVITETCHYLNGLKHGQEIKYYHNFKNSEYYISNISNYYDGILNGSKVSFWNNDTLAYEFYINGLLHGRCFYKQEGFMSLEIEYKAGIVDGNYKDYYYPGILANHILFKNGLPYTVYAANSKNGDSLFAGTLINGNGCLEYYYANGKLRSSFNYNNQLICGPILHLYKNGDTAEIGVINSISSLKTNASKYRPNYDINVYVANQLNFGTDTKVNAFSNSGVLLMEYQYIDSTNYCTHCIYEKKYYKSGELSNTYFSFSGLAIGPSTKYYKSGKPKSSSYDKIIHSDSSIESVKHGRFNYFYENGNLQASIYYQNGFEIDTSFFYNEDRELIRRKIVYQDGSEKNIFNGDTVNCKDSHGWKQGKWLYIPYDKIMCRIDPYRLDYYTDNFLQEVWRNNKKYGWLLEEKYEWINSCTANYSGYAFGKLSETGTFWCDYERVGIWYQYHEKTGRITRQMEYRGDYVRGSLIEFKRNGKMKRKYRK